MNVAVVDSPPTLAGLPDVAAVVPLASADPVELTILMPCLNEARTVGTCVQKARAYLSSAGVVGEVLVADNGSTDGSQDIALEAGAAVVEVRERGYGAALLAGIRAARGRFVIMGDADDSYDFLALHPFVQALRRGEQLVMGNRFAGGIAPGAMPKLHRYLGNPVLSFIGRLFFRSPVRDFHCGLRGFDREAVAGLGLNATGMEFASEMIVKSTLNGLRVCEVPTTLAPDGRDRAPHLRSWRDGWRHLRFLLLHAPAWLFMYPGLLLLVAGSTASVALAMGPLPLGFVTLDVHSLAYSAAAACLGLQMVMFAGASSYHAVRIGVLPQLPESLDWIRVMTLERFLVVAAILMCAGLGLAATSIWMWWSQSGFRGMDPTVLMRVVIPAAMLMLAAGQVAICAFLVEVVRLAPSGPARRAADAS